MLTREGSPFRVPLDILPLGGTGYPRNVHNLPSWAPDWSNVPPAYMLALVLRLLRQVVSEELPTRIVYELVGECYVHGMMDGEMMSEDLTAVLLV
jgi:hypothetical protein